MYKKIKIFNILWADVTLVSQPFHANAIVESAYNNLVTDVKNIS